MSKTALFQISAILISDFQKRKQLHFSEENDLILKLHKNMKKDTILLVTFTF